jgi:hypothetical protein
MDEIMGEIALFAPEAPSPAHDDLPVESMNWTLAEHYAEDERLPVGDARQFDRDLRRVFATATDASAGEPASGFLRRHEGELVARISYWAGVAPSAVRSLVRALADRTATLDLRVTGLEAATLIELTAFGTAVTMHWRYTQVRSGSGPAVTR